MNIKDSMNLYYNERAEEYDEIYTLGKGPASISDPKAYKEDVQNVLGVIQKVNPTGSIFDIPCGTGFWMPGYYKNVESIHLFDQSTNMLRKAIERARELNCGKKCTCIETDILKIENYDIHADFALVGFFLSHLEKQDEKNFIEYLKEFILDRIIIIDSTWSNERAETRKKKGKQIRRLNDGTDFNIYKKYYTKTDVHELGQEYGLNTDDFYFGRTMFVASFQKNQI